MINKYSLSLLFSGLMVVTAKAQATDTKQNEDTTNVNQEAPVFVTSLEDLDNSSSGQSTSGLLQSSRDVYSQAAAYNFGVARFRIRGYNSNQTVLMINGVPMNDLESGNGTWYKWSGLNDVTRYAESKRWLTNNDYHFGGLGGYSNIDASATGIRKGRNFSYALTNRSYRHRAMYTQGTGMMSNGWAFSGSMTYRYAKEGYVEGTFYNGLSYFAAAKKQINDKNTLNFTILGAPTHRGKQGISVQEAYDLTDNPYYNSYWGYQTLPNGTQIKRNSRQVYSHIPVAMLNHEWKINKQSKLTSSITGSAGYYGQTALNWNDANDPRPDYYRYLPYYYELINDEANANYYRNKWLTDDSFGQVQWDDLYYANSKNLYSQENVNGVEGNTVVGNRAKYIVETRWNNVVSFGTANNYTNQLNDHMKLVSGIFLNYQRNHYYKTIDDLLGADFWLDVDRFASQLGVDESYAQSDINNPNNLVREGDVFGYDYYIHNYKASTFGQMEFTYSKVDFYGALELTESMFYREGVMVNGKFPENSGGKSDVANFLTYGVKGGATYKVSGRQFVNVNAYFKTEPPLSRNSFISPRTRDYLVDNLQVENIYSGDISYILKYPKLKLRATYYYTERKNAIWSRSFYHDTYNSFVNYVMTGVDYLNQGLEFGVDATVYGGLSANAAVAYGQYIYTSRPTANVYVDNSSELLAENKTVYLKNYKVGGMPQSAATIGLKYSGKKYWFAGVNFNYYADIYLDPNPDRRTEEAVANYVSTDPQWTEMIEQTQLDNGYSLSAFAGKSFKIGQNYLNVTINANNITNNKSFATGGYEQLRYDPSSISKFPNKLGYMYGANYFVMLKYRF